MADSEQRTVRRLADAERRFYVVPHTHWDREWYAPFEHFRLALGRVVDGVLDVLEADPAFSSFTLDGQAIVLEDYLDVRPAHEGRLRALLAAGRLEVGPGYVLPDELLVGAEPLVRNLLIGRAVCRRFGAEPAPVGYLPDSFGHPEQLPQILAGFGIGTFLFSRGLGDELDTHGVVFRWRAPDGSEVVAFQLLPHYDNFAALDGADDAAERVAAILDRFGPALDRAGLGEVLLCNGSDHLPIQPELPELCRALHRRRDGADIQIARYGDYARDAAPDELPVLTGELLGSRLQNVLRGVNSARLYLKQANQRAEQRLLAVETLAAVGELAGGERSPLPELTLAWRELLRCQPHDSICGCSCDEVHRDMLVRYDSLHRTLSDVVERLVPGAPAAPNAVTVFNPLPGRRRRVLERPGSEPVAAELDGFEARAVRLPPARPHRAPAADAPTTIENDRFRVDADPDGRLTLLDKRSGRRYERLHGLEDEADMGDLYTFCPVEGAPRWSVTAASLRIRRRTPQISELEVLVEAATLSIRTVVRLTDGSDRVEFTTRLENRGRDHRLRVVFPVGAAEGPVRAEGQFALVRRALAPPAPRAEWAEPPDLTAHTLGAVALGALAILTKGLPEYEARTTDDGAELCLTLVRSVGVISRPAGALATRPLSAGPATPTPEGQCLGRHELEYALLPGADELGEAELLRAAQDYRTGFLELPSGPGFAPALTLEGDVVFSCLKGAEDGDGLILRCFNPGSGPATGRVGGSVEVARTRLDEMGETPLPGGVAELAAGEIATLRLRPPGR